MTERHNPHPNVMLVYQGGIANVFSVEHFGLTPEETGRRERLQQFDFRSCQYVAAGMGLAGSAVRTAACNAAGDIASLEWTYDLDSQPFSDQLTTVECEGI